MIKNLGKDALGNEQEVFLLPEASLDSSEESDSEIDISNSTHKKESDDW